MPKKKIPKKHFEKDIAVQGASVPSTRLPALRQRHPPDTQRARIILAAQQVIAEHGYPAASARTIAAQCGISPGTLTYHFPTVDALLVAALRDASSQFTETIVASARKRSSSAKARLMYLIDAALPTSVNATRNWRLWLEYWARAAHNATLAQLHSDRYTQWRGAFVAFIDEGVANGELLQVDSNSCAIELVALLDGLGLQAVIADSAVSIEVARTLLQRAIENLSSAVPLQSALSCR